MQFTAKRTKVYWGNNIESYSRTSSSSWASSLSSSSLSPSLLSSSPSSTSCHHYKIFIKICVPFKLVSSKVDSNTSLRFIMGKRVTKSKGRYWDCNDSRSLSSTTANKHFTFSSFLYLRTNDFPFDNLIDIFKALLSSVLSR